MAAMNARQKAAANPVYGVRRTSALLNPLRLQLLEAMQAPTSASGLARQFDLPRQQVNYHLRELEKEGFVELVEERRKGNCVERIVRATANYYLVNPPAMKAMTADAMQLRDQFSSTYLVAVAARAVRDLAMLRTQAEKAGKRLATFTLQTEVRFASAAVRNEFTQQLTNEVARLIARYHDEKNPSGRRFQFFIGCYPSVTKKVEAESASKEKP
jgi:DNA-binding transcriptional ArsR family regulator